VALFRLFRDEFVGGLLRFLIAAELLRLRLAGGPQPAKLDREARPGDVDRPELLRISFLIVKLTPAHGAAPLAGVDRLFWILCRPRRHPASAVARKQRGEDPSSFPAQVSARCAFSAYNDKRPARPFVIPELREFHFEGGTHAANKRTDGSRLDGPDAGAELPTHGRGPDAEVLPGCLWQVHP